MIKEFLKKITSTTCAGIPIYIIAGIVIIAVAGYYGKIYLNNKKK